MGEKNKSKKKIIIIIFIILGILLVGVLSYMTYDKIFKDNQIEEINNDKEEIESSNKDEVCSIDVNVVIGEHFDNYNNDKNCEIININNFKVNNVEYNLRYEMSDDEVKIYLDDNLLDTISNHYFYEFTIYTYKNYYILDFTTSSYAATLIKNINDSSDSNKIFRGEYGPNSNGYLNKINFDKFMGDGIIAGNYNEKSDNYIIKSHKVTINLVNGYNYSDEIDETFNCKSDVDSNDFDNFSCDCVSAFDLYDYYESKGYDFMCA